MGVKLIAIGNRLMGDEGIAVKLAETLMDGLHSLGIDVILGETDMDFCFDMIDDGDFILILDATCYGLEPGAITVVPINKYNIRYSHSMTQHDLSMLKLFNNAPTSLSGYLIGIEVDTISFDLDLSDSLKNKFSKLCSKVEKIVSVLKDNPLETDLTLALNIL